MDTAASRLAAANPVLVLGIGDLLRRDAGAGVHVARALSRRSAASAVHVLDLGLLGCPRLAELEAGDALLATASLPTPAPAGTVTLYVGRAVERALGRAAGAAEAPLADLLARAQRAGRLPRRRALISIAPADRGWGGALTPAVAAALPTAVETARRLIRGWRTGTARGGPRAG